MYKRLSGLLLALICLASPVIAQEGHPLVGTWQGDWGAAGDTPENRNFLTIIMNWDGKAITGLVNPGPDSAEITAAVLDSSDWTVHFELNLKDAAGASVHFVGEGQIENIGSQVRTMTGTWSDGNKSGTFAIERQSGA